MGRVVDVEIPVMPLPYDRLVSFVRQVSCGLTEDPPRGTPDLPEADVLRVTGVLRQTRGEAAEDRR